jgi:hypothetical protein
MGTTTTAQPPGVAAALHANLELSHRCLATAAWLRAEHLPNTARVVLALSDGHAALAHRLAQLFAQHGHPAALSSLQPPRATFESVREAVRELLLGEAQTLAAAHDSITGAAASDRSLAAGLAGVLPYQHRLSRATGSLADAVEHALSLARLEHWARGRRATPPPTTSIHAVSTGSHR